MKQGSIATSGHLVRHDQAENYLVFSLVPRSDRLCNGLNCLPHNPAH